MVLLRCGCESGLRGVKENARRGVYMHGRNGRARSSRDLRNVTASILVLGDSARQLSLFAPRKILMFLKCPSSSLEGRRHA